MNGSYGAFGIISRACKAPEAFPTTAYLILTASIYNKRESAFAQKLTPANSETAQPIRAQFVHSPGSTQRQRVTLHFPSAFVAMKTNQR